MFDEPAQLRAKAEASRRLADMSEDAERKAFWLDRADYWERLATSATKQPKPRVRKRKTGPLWWVLSKKSADT